MNNSKKLCSATLVFVILSLLLSCSHETKSIQPVDVDTVLSWQIPAETMPELKKLPILSGHSVHVSETTLEDAARTFMENANLPNTDNTHDTLIPIFPPLGPIILTGQERMAPHLFPLTWMAKATAFHFPFLLVLLKIAASVKPLFCQIKRQSPAMSIPQIAFSKAWTWIS